MTRSLTGQPPQYLARAVHFVAAVPGVQIDRSLARSGTSKIFLRRDLKGCGAVHALLADEHGAWSWAPGDPHAAATRHASVQEWIRDHPGYDLSLWVAGPLVRSVEGDPGPAHQDGNHDHDHDDESLRSHARRELVGRHGPCAADWALATWKTDVSRGVCALAGIDLVELNRHARQHQVRLRSVVPWWYHAFQEARRCVNALNRAAEGAVCVVEGRQIAWVKTTLGRLASVHQTTLDTACVDALRLEIGRMSAQTSSHEFFPVVLGQGLEDGARTERLGALVLGRLDGQQPPQWLRPSFQEDML